MDTESHLYYWITAARPYGGPQSSSLLAAGFDLGELPSREIGDLLKNSL